MTCILASYIIQFHIYESKAWQYNIKTILKEKVSISYRVSDPSTRKPRSLFTGIDLLKVKGLENNCFIQSIVYLKLCEPLANSKPQARYNRKSHPSGERNNNLCTLIHATKASFFHSIYHLIPFLPSKYVRLRQEPLESPMYWINGEKCATEVWSKTRKA